MEDNSLNLDDNDSNDLYIDEEDETDSGNRDTEDGDESEQNELDEAANFIFNGYNRYPRSVEYDTYRDNGESLLNLTENSDQIGKLAKNDIDYIEYNSIIDIIVISYPDIIVVPGQIIPFKVTHSFYYNLLRNKIGNSSVFGIIPYERVDKKGYNAKNLQNVGCVVKVLNDDITDSSYLKVKVLGIARLEALKIWDQNGITIASVRILPEMDLISPIKKDLDFYSNIGNQQNKKLLPACTTFPLFVYEMYDTDKLQNRLMNHLDSWASTNMKDIKYLEPSERDTGESVSNYNNQTSQTITKKGSKINLNSKEPSERIGFTAIPPQDPNVFSFWVAYNLPYTNRHRLQILSLNCPIQRFRYELCLLEDLLNLTCYKCQTKICEFKDIFCMTKKGPQNAYINNSGTTFEVITCSKSNISDDNRKTLYYTWFPGYAWSIGSCKYCHSFVGWRFTATKKDLKPQEFYGFKRAAIQFGFDSNKKEKIIL